MATTARVAATTDSSTAYTFSVASGETKSFAAIGLTEDSESVTLEISDSSAAYTALKYVDKHGNKKTAQMTAANNTLQVNGAVDARFNKTATAASVEVVEYT